MITASSIIEADWKGERRRLVVAEAVNIGSGWLFRTVDDKPVGIAHQSDLTNVKVVGACSIADGGRLEAVIDRRLSNDELKKLTE